MRSGRGAARAGDFAAGVGWPGRDGLLAAAIGLRHDVARFPQYRRYGTFSDARSIDHGDAGAGILGERFSWDLLPPGSREIVIAAVGAHNKRFVPAGLPAGSMPFVLMIRDCDKLDVFRIVRDHEADGTLLEIYPRLEPGGPASSDVLSEVLESRTASYEKVHTMADLYLLKMAWVHSLSNAPAYRHLVATGFLDWIEPRLPRAEGVPALLAETRALVAERSSQVHGQ